MPSQNSKMPAVEQVASFIMSMHKYLEPPYKI